jgi:drug/metabolite transporter (DMT)-like permease
MTNAMKTAEASVVVTLDFLRLPLIAAIGVVFYSEALKPMLIGGASLMLIGNLINIYKSKKNAPS